MDALIRLLVTGGAPLAAGIVFLEQFGLPVPGMPALIVAGALARQGRLSAVEIFLASVACSVLADALWYGFGMRFGDRALRLATTLSASPGIVARSEALMRRYGAMLLVIGRFVPPISMVSVPLAGASGLPLRAFLLFDVGGAVLWVGAGIAVGAVLHQQVESVLSSLALLDRGLGALTALLLAYLLWRYVRSRKLAPYVLRRLVPDRVLQRLDAHDVPSSVGAPVEGVVRPAERDADFDLRAPGGEPSARPSRRRLRSLEAVGGRSRQPAGGGGQPGRVMR